MSDHEAAEHREAMAMSIKEAAQRLAISEGLLWKLIKRGDVAVIRLGGRTLIATHELRRLIGADA